jgi:hypothetical protein
MSNSPIIAVAAAVMLVGFASSALAAASSRHGPPGYTEDPIMPPLSPPGAGMPPRLQ